MKAVMLPPLAWYAGLFEGEGTLTITRADSGRHRRGYTRPRCCLTMTDRQVIDLFNKRWPGMIQTHVPKGNARRVWTWTLNSRDRIRQFVEDVAPHFVTDRVRAKAMLLIEDLDARQQGARDPAYIDGCNDRRERMALLNKRGAA